MKNNVVFLLLFFLTGCSQSQSPVTIETAFASYTQTVVWATFTAPETSTVKTLDARHAMQTKDAMPTGTPNAEQRYKNAVSTLNAQATAKAPKPLPTKRPNSIYDYGCCDYPECAYSQPKLGMTEKEVYHMCGAPDKRNETITSHGISSQWVYTATKGNRQMYIDYMYFENHILVAMQK